MANEEAAIASLSYILFTLNPADLSLSSKDFYIALNVQFIHIVNSYFWNMSPVEVFLSTYRYVQFMLL